MTLYALGLARVLATNTAAIAAHPDAGQCYNDIQKLCDDIEHRINRPKPPRYLGPCNARLTDNYGQRVCRTELTAQPDDIEIQCPECKTTHNVDKLLQQQIDDTDEMSFTITELQRTILPALRLNIPLRTLQHWSASSRLVPTGYDSAGDPKFLLGDVRRLHAAKPQKAPTGAAAHRKD
ncbi:MAG: hypothetical protein J2P17_17060 [Mycobacterium sp.]|nr:hypothetical protein [Mycobacterium sp.]